MVEDVFSAAFCVDKELVSVEQALVFGWFMANFRWARTLVLK
jgi:hypothetical protein